VVVALVVVAIGVGVVASLHHTKAAASTTTRQILPAAVTGTSTVQTPPQRVTNPTSIKGVLAWNTAGYPGPGKPGSGTLTHDHVAGPVKYAVTPPVGGPHNATWMNAGVYTKPVPAERAVHNLEHGAVWITYRPGLPAAQVDRLRSLVRGQTYLTLSPYPGLPAAVVASAWGKQIRLTGADDSRLDLFITKYRQSPQAPEGCIAEPPHPAGWPRRDGRPRTPHPPPST